MQIIAAQRATYTQNSGLLGAGVWLVLTETRPGQLFSSLTNVAILSRPLPWQEMADVPRQSQFVILSTAVEDLRIPFPSEQLKFQKRAYVLSSNCKLPSYSGLKSLGSGVDIVLLGTAFETGNLHTVLHYVRCLSPYHIPLHVTL